MKRTAIALMLMIATAAGAAPFGGATLEDGPALLEPDPAAVTSWMLWGKNMQELRLGYQRDWIEVALGIEHLGEVDDDDKADMLGLRLYALLHALDMDAIGKLFGANLPVPDGAIYAGPYLSYACGPAEWGNGLVVGGLVDVRANVAVTLEYHHDWEPVPGTDIEYQVLAGLRIRF